MKEEGRVKIVFSDNGTNFRKSYSLMSELKWDKILEYSNLEKIKWVFNAPAAPWWTGMCERLVRSVKELLRRNLGRAFVTSEELNTLLCDVESIINARPLTYVDESDELIAITPAKFIQDIPSSDVSDLDEIDSNSLNNRIKYIKRLRDLLRERFRVEYQAMLFDKGKKGKYEDIKVNDVVLIETEDKRTLWPIGRIIEVIPGRDGIVRTARVKTKRGEFIRPIQRLFNLEISSYENQNSSPAIEKVKVLDEVVQVNDVRTRSGRVVKPTTKLSL